MTSLNKNVLNSLLITIFCIYIINCSRIQGRNQNNFNSKKHPYGVHTNIINFSEERGVVIDYESINILLHPFVADRKIVVFSIVGAFRKGKSFLMDYCLRFMYANYKSINYMNNPINNKAKWMGRAEEPLTGFSWKGGKTRHTTGVVMWSDIFLHEQNGEKFAIVLMDTQGLFDNVAPTADSMKIFALNSLLSSFLIFNLNDLIQENQLEYLQMSTSYAQLISKLNDNEATTNSKPFQDILFLLRDYVHIDDHPYGLEGGNEYVRQTLKVRNSIIAEYSDEDDENTQQRSESLQEVRKYIYSTFENIYGYLMPPPGRNVTSLRSFDGRWSMLDDDFKLHLFELVEWMLSPQNLKKKQIFSQDLTAKSFHDYLRVYSKAFQSPDIPEVQSIYEITVEQQMMTFSDESIAQYRTQMSKFEDPSLPNFPQLIEREYRKAKQLSIDFFNSKKKLGNSNHETRFREILSKKIDETYSSWKTDLLKTYQKIAEIQAVANETQNALVREREEANKKFDVMVQSHNQQWEVEKKRREAAEKVRDEQLNEVMNKSKEVENRLLAEQNRIKLEHEKQIAEYNQKKQEEDDKREAEFNKKMTEIQNRNTNDMEALNKDLGNIREQREIELKQREEEDKARREQFEVEKKRQEQERDATMREFNNLKSTYENRINQMEEQRKEEEERRKKDDEENNKKWDNMITKHTENNKNLNDRLQSITNSYEGKINDLTSKLKNEIESRKNSLFWHSWANSQQNVPTDAISAGVDKDGSMLYVIRGRNGCDLMPGKFSANRKEAYLSSGSNEIKINQFELLRGTTHYWMSTSTSDGREMFQGGKFCDGNTLYICRGYVDGYLTPGRYQSGYCKISYDGGEKNVYSGYEILKV